MKGEHYYKVKVSWTGNKGEGTTSYRSYERSHTIHIEGKTDVLGSSDSAFRGDASKHNPEDLLLSSLAACHMLWYLHFCADAGVVVMNYSDEAQGYMIETAKGGHFSEVVLYPVVTVRSAEMVAQAKDLHKLAHEYCFIANSVNFPVRHVPKIEVCTE